MDETPGPSESAETVTEDASEERTAHEILCQFSEEWLKVLDRDDKIERVWAQLKRFTKGHCKYTLPSLRKNIPLAYDTVSLDNIKNHFRKVKHFMFGYLECFKPGTELDEALKKYKVAAKSHRRIGVND